MSTINTLHHPKRWTATLWTLLAIEYPDGERLYRKQARQAMIKTARRLEIEDTWHEMGLPIGGAP